MNIQKLFKTGMKRNIPDLLEDHGYQIELGGGYHRHPGCNEYFDLPEWDTNNNIIAPQEFVDVIHMYHFLEHINDPIELLFECQEILKSGGHINIVVPYYKSSLAIEDLDHKHQFCEDTWRNIFENSGYNRGYEWELKVHFNIIMGIQERNLCLITQLQKH